LGLENIKSLLTYETEMIFFNIQEYIKLIGEGSAQEDLLEGHVCVARELTAFLPPEKKYELGCDPSGNVTSLIRVSIFTKYESI